jgi:hypothetical protein
VRKGGNRVRITAQLIDAQSGSHLWAERYDGELTDVFALQDEITQQVVAAIEPKLLEAEGLRSQHRSPTDIGAWDMVIQANSLFWRLNRADGEEAIAMLRRAVEHSLPVVESSLPAWRARGISMKLAPSWRG